MRQEAQLDEIREDIITATEHYVAQADVKRPTAKLSLSHRSTKAIRAKHQARRVWLTNRTEATYQVYKRKCKLVRTHIRLDREKRLTRLLNKYKKYMQANEPRLAHEKLNEAIKLATRRGMGEHRDKLMIPSDALKKHYQQLFKATRPTDLLEHTLWCKDEDDREPDFTMNDLEQALKHTKNNEAPGPNGIRSELVKYGGRFLKERLISMMNQYWRGDVGLPTEWRNAEVVSIYKKKGAKTDPNNYRSIFLLDTIEKIFAGLVCQRLNAYTADKLSDNQMGFRRDHSTMQAIICVRHIIQNARDQHTPLVLAFVDLKKAFDSVPHRAIMDTLDKLNLPARIGNCIKQLICKPVGHIRNSADSFILERGVRQGSKEGPHLFNLALDEILRQVYEGMAPTTRMTQNSGAQWSVSHIAYADDLCLFTSSIDELKRTLERLHIVLREWGMEMSFAKTKWMAITPTTTSDAQLIIDGQEIEKVNRFKYLGSIIEDDGNPRSAVKDNIRRARYALIRIRCALRSNKLTMKMKTHLIECYVKPVLYYGLETIVLTAQLSDMMEAVLDTAKRMILGLNSRRSVEVEELRRKVSLKTVAGQLQKRRLNLWVSMHKSSNTYARKLLCSKLKDKRSYRVAHTRQWLRQLRNDAQDCCSNAEDSYKIASPSLNQDPSSKT